jgi:molecular chaperone GrpE
MTKKPPTDQSPDEKLSTKKPSKWDQLKKATAEATLNADLDSEVDKNELSRLSALDQESLIDMVLSLQKTVKESHDKLLREIAEKENMNTRTQREISNARKYGNDKILQDMIPVIDSLEQSVISSGEQEHMQEGIELTHKKLLTSLQKHGVEPVDALHQPFNPEFHEAMSMQESQEYPPNTVITVVQQGYILHGRLLRPAMVMVSKAPSE